MKPKLIDRGRVPYGNFFVLKDKARGLVGKGLYFDALMDDVKKYRHANGLPITLSLEDDVEALCCQEYPQECKETDPTIPVKRKMTTSMVIAGTRVMLAHKLAGSPLESEAVAISRAAICAKCPFNVVFPKPCGVAICDELKRIVESVIGSKTTPFHDQLNSCSICGCYLSASVWVPLDIQCVGVNPEQRAQFDNVRKGPNPKCWKVCASP